jgi:hypothetical protein
MYSQYVAVSAGTKEYNENLLSGKLASAPRVEPDPELPEYEFGVAPITSPHSLDTANSERKE